MSISAHLRAKWDELLYNWLLYRADVAAANHGGAPISSIYSGEQYRSKGYRNKRDPVLEGKALDTDDLMVQLSEPSTAYLYRAIVEWARNDGTRGAQAARLSLHERTYRNRADSAIAYLEALWLMRKFKKKSTKTRFLARTL